MLRLSASVLIGTALAISSWGCGRRVAEQECVMLLDRYTELLIREEQPGTSAEQIAEMKAAARHGARFDATFEFDRCPAEISRRQYECAMTAPDVNAIERCLVL